MASSKKWNFVKKTFNALGIAKVAAPSSSNNNNNNDDDDDDDDDKNDSADLSQYNNNQEHPHDTMHTEDEHDEVPRKSATKNHRSSTTQGKANIKPYTKKKRQSTNKKKTKDNLKLMNDRKETSKDLQKTKHQPSEENIFICQALGMNPDGMCLRHPNQPITELLGHPNQNQNQNPHITLEEVHLCRICDSESQIIPGRHVPKQRKSMATVIGQVKQLQANRIDWRKRTRAMFWTSQQALEFDNNDNEDENDKDDDDLEANLLFATISPKEWEAQVTSRVTQVMAWKDQNHPVQAHPTFARYFKMLQMGIPLEAAKNACEMDGYPGVVLDLDPTKSLRSQLHQLEDNATQQELREYVQEESPWNTPQDKVDEKNTNQEQDLEPDEIVNRVRRSFEQLKSKEMLQAVHTIHKLETKAAARQKKRDSTAETKEGFHQDDVATKKKKKKGKKTKKTQSSEHGTADETNKKKKTKRKSSSAAKDKKPKSTSALTDRGRMESIAEGSGGSTIVTLQETIVQKDTEIAHLKEQLRQKDVIIQNLSKRPLNAPEQAASGAAKGNDLTLVQSNNHSVHSTSEHAVVLQLSDNEGEDEDDIDDDDDDDEEISTKARQEEIAADADSSRSSKKEIQLQGYVDELSDGNDDDDDDDDEEVCTRDGRQKIAADAGSCNKREIQLQGYDFVTGESKEQNIEGVGIETQYNEQGINTGTSGAQHQNETTPQDSGHNDAGNKDIIFVKGLNVGGDSDDDDDNNNAQDEVSNTRDHDENVQKDMTENAEEYQDESAPQVSCYDNDSNNNIDENSVDSSQTSNEDGDSIIGDDDFMSDKEENEGSRSMSSDDAGVDDTSNNEDTSHAEGHEVEHDILEVEPQNKESYERVPNDDEVAINDTTVGDSVKEDDPDLSSDEAVASVSLDNANDDSGVQDEDTNHVESGKEEQDIFEAETQERITNENEGNSMVIKDKDGGSGIDDTSASDSVERDDASLSSQDGNSASVSSGEADDASDHEVQEKVVEVVHQDGETLERGSNAGNSTHVLAKDHVDGLPVNDAVSGNNIEEDNECSTSERAESASMSSGDADDESEKLHVSS